MLADAAARRAAIAPKLGDANKMPCRQSLSRLYTTELLLVSATSACLSFWPYVDAPNSVGAEKPADSGEADLAATVLLLGVRGTLAVGVCGGLLSRIAAAMRLGGFLQSGGVLALAV
jgi:hypothetical protein